MREVEKDVEGSDYTMKPFVWRNWGKTWRILSQSN